jgi:hypothetical protein
VADERILYAPDVVGVDRLFMVALKLPEDAGEVRVRVPAAVALLDRRPRSASPSPLRGGSLRPATGPRGGATGERSTLHRFYFRALRPSKAATIRFALPGGEVSVTVAIWSFDDLREYRSLKGERLPRRWPLGEALPELKQGQTVTTAAQVAATKGNPGAAPAWLEQPDEAIWAMQPDSTLPRWHWVNIAHGCPIHGTEIYRKQPYYPWEKDLALPWKWKIRCPVGGEEYPSNAIGRGDFTSGDFVDDGVGGGFVSDGRHYGFIAEINQAYCHQMLRVAPECAQGYLATGDRRYVHKALVAFCRLAVEYAYLATMTQHRHRNSAVQVERFGQGRFDEGPFLAASGFTVYSIDQPAYQSRLAEAYDRIFPAIDREREIVPFLRKKGFAVKSPADVRRFIEENLFAVWMQGTMDGACYSNEPFAQRGFARMAEVLNYARGGEFMEWLYDGGGKMRVFVTNGFFRDGSPYESTGGYNGMHVSSLGPIVDSIEHLRALRPEVYPEASYPSLSRSRRYRNVFDFDLETVTLDRTFPAIGDTGGPPVYQKLSRVTWQSGGAAAFEHAYRLFREPKLAWALVHAPGWEPSVEFPFTRDELAREAAKWPGDWNDRSSLHDGYGVAILRGGAGDAKRALWLRYGRARSHTQDDLMDIGLQAYEGVLLAHMGYPRNWGYWEHSWSSHHVARQRLEGNRFATMTAQAELFAESSGRPPAGPVHLAEARAQAYVDDVDAGRGYRLLPDVWQRRLLALIDAGPDRFYAVDFYRIAGGEEHWSAFHAQEGELRLTGVALTPQDGGTLAGPDVPYGDPKWLEANGCTHGVYGWSGPMFAFAHLYNVQRGTPQGAGAPAAVWSADWALKSGEGLHLRVTGIGDSATEPPAPELIVCDGKSPAGGSPYEMKWLMRHHRRASGSDHLRTQLLNLLEAYRGEPVISEARPLALSGADEAGFRAAGCVVRMSDRTDTLLVSADPSVEREAEGGVRFAGRFGFIAEQEGEIVAMALIGGTRLQRGDVRIRSERGEYRGRITALDREAETITVSPAPPEPSRLVGATLFITNAHRRIAYRVRSARGAAGGAELHLEGDSRIGTGRVTGTEDGRVLTKTPFPLHRFRYYHGARLVNAARSVEYSIIEVRDQVAAILDGAAHPEANKDRLAGEFPAGSWFDVYDYGMGDEVVWPYAVSLTRTQPGVYRLDAPGPVEVRLPEGCRVEREEARGNSENEPLVERRQP